MSKTDYSNLFISDNELCSRKQLQQSTINSIDEIISSTPILPASNGKPVAESIMDILISKKVRKTPLQYLSHAYLSDLEQSISQYIRQGIPINVTFQSFSFKVNINPLKTNRSIPDLGELALLTRLRSINKTVQQVYPPGISFNVVFESHALRDIFRIQDQEAEAYIKTIKDWIEKIADTKIELYDLALLIKNFPDFQDIYQSQFEHYKNQLERDPTSFKARYSDHIKAMMQNISLKGYSLPTLIFALLLKESSHERDQIERDASIITARYKAFYYARNALNVIQASIPNSLWFSIVTVPNRYGFHPVHHESKILPYHGVPILCRKKNKVFITHLYKVLSRPNEFEAIHITNDSENKPFFLP